VIRDSRFGPDELMKIFRSEAKDLLPIAFVDEGGPAPETASLPIDVDQTLTLALPARGEIQVRVEEANDRVVTLATVEGHPLAGIVRFSAEPADEGVRFQIEVYARAANLLDLVAMKAGGQAAQRSAWENGVAAVVERSGGSAPEGVEHSRDELEGDEARRVEQWITGMVQSRNREQRSPSLPVERRPRRGRRRLRSTEADGSG
jgi:hypothetical protein